MLNRELEELIDLIGGEGYVLRALDIHRTTLLRWRSGKTLPSQATMDLLRGLAGSKMPWAGKDWDGWRFERGQLLGPEGEHFSAGQLKAWHIERQLLAAQRAEIDRLRGLVQSLAKDAKVVDIAANDVAAWEGDPRALPKPKPEPARAPQKLTEPPAREPHPYTAFKRRAASLGRR